MTLADEAAGALGDRIKGFKVTMVKAAAQVDELAWSAAASVNDTGNARWQISFGVDRQHASADAAAAFLADHPAAFATPPRANFDVKVTVGATARVVKKAAMTLLEPDEHSDQSTFIRYGWMGETYS